MTNLQFRECYFKLVEFEKWSCKLCPKMFLRPAYRLLQNHIRDDHSHVNQRELNEFRANLQSGDELSCGGAIEEIKKLIETAETVNSQLYAAYHCSNRKKRESEGSRDTQSGGNRAVRRRLRPKETLFEFYDRAAKKWIFLEEDDPRVAVPRKKRAADGNIASMAVDPAVSDDDVDDSDYSDNANSNSSSNSSSSSSSTSNSADASHSRSRNSSVDKKNPLRSGKVRVLDEPKRLQGRDSSSSSEEIRVTESVRVTSWTAGDDDQLRAIVLQHGARKWKHVAALLGDRWSDRQCNRRWKLLLKESGSATAMTSALDDDRAASQDFLLGEIVSSAEFDGNKGSTVTVGRDSESESELESYCEDGVANVTLDDAAILAVTEPAIEQQSPVIATSEAPSPSSSESVFPSAESLSHSSANNNGTVDSTVIHHRISPNPPSSSNSESASIQRCGNQLPLASSTDAPLPKDNAIPAFVITVAQEQYLEKLRELHARNLITTKVWEAMQMASLGLPKYDL